MTPNMEGIDIVQAQNGAMVNNVKRPSVVMAAAWSLADAP